MRPGFGFMQYRRSKLILIGFFIVFIIATAVYFTFGKRLASALVNLPVFPTQGLYPSVKLTDYIVGDQLAIDWLASHDDFIFSAPTPADNWYSKPEYNQNLVIGRYFELTILNLLEESSDSSSGSSHQSETIRWYKDNALDDDAWEAGFAHLGTEDTNRKQDHKTTGSEIDAKIRFVYRNTSNVNYREDAWDGITSLSLAGSTDEVYFGRLDRFDEVNLEFSTTADSTWNGIWQYWNGSTWANLTSFITSDTTSDCQGNGKVTFTPPTRAQWKKTQVNGVPQLWGPQGVYFVRLKTNVVGVRGPVIKKAQGRHYWVPCRYVTVTNPDGTTTTTFVCDGSGTSGNRIPAWDPNNDSNGDGYVGAGEGTANSLATAKFKYESRIPNFNNWSQFNVNVANTNLTTKYTQYAIDYMHDSDGTLHKYYGAYLDNMFGTINHPTEITTTGRVLEYPGLKDISNTDKPLTARWDQDVEQNIIIPTVNAFHANGYLLAGNVGWSGIALFNQHFDYFLRETAAGATYGGANHNCGIPNWEDHLLPATSTAEWMLRGDQGKYMGWQWQLTLYDWFKTKREKYEGTATISTVNGTQILGSNSHWLETVDKGSILQINSKFAEVDAVISNTEVRLKTAPFTSSDTGAGFTFFTARDKMAGLTSFMILQKPQVDYLNLWWGTYYTGTRSQWMNWIPAITKDYGSPTGYVPSGKTARGTRGAYIMQTGDDLTSSSPYVVYARDYTKALVLYRPPSCSGSNLADSAITVNLPEPMKVVDYFGNIASTAVSSVSLRNTEGVILMKTSAVGGIDLEKSANKTSASSGEIITYTIHYTVGTQNVTAAKIEDDVTAGASYVAGSAKVGTTAKTDSCTDGDGYCFSSPRATWTLGNLIANATGTVSFQVRVQ